MNSSSLARFGGCSSALVPSTSRRHCLQRCKPQQAAQRKMQDGWTSWALLRSAFSSPAAPAPSRRVKTAAEPPATAGSGGTCSACGARLEEAEKGCDGEGRILGGLAALPGLGWWPIRAYRPCPKLNDAGVEYVRKGQATNDVLFGGVSLGRQGSQTLDEMKRTAEKGIDIK